MLFQLVYDGPALNENEFEVRKLTSALLAMDSLLRRSDSLVNAGQTSIKVSVKASFKTGSFQIDLSTVQSLLEQAKSLFLSDPSMAVVNASALFGMVFGSAKGLFWLIKFLAGGKPEKLIENEDGTFTVYRSGRSEVVERKVIELFRDYQTRQALGELVTDQLEKDGIDSFAIFRDGTEPVVTVTKSEAAYFRCPPFPEHELGTNIYETNLNLVRISFKEGNKWRVTDGNTEFSVTVEDEEFLRKVESSSVQFSKGDILKVRLRQSQFAGPTGIITTYVIEKVLNHANPPAQFDLDV